MLNALDRAGQKVVTMKVNSSETIATEQRKFSIPTTGDSHKVQSNRYVPVDGLALAFHDLGEPSPPIVKLAARTGAARKAALFGKDCHR